MRIPRVYVAARLKQGVDIHLDAEQARYLGKVLRLEAGAEIVVFNGEGGEFRARVVALKGTSGQVRVETFVDSRRESPLKVTLVQGISRGERMDFTVQKAVELGVHAIVPVMTERSVVRLEGERLQRRLKHWQSIALNACQQCGRTRPPAVGPISTLEDWLQDFAASAPMTGLLLTPTASLSLDGFSEPPQEVALFIGPEGGLSDAEQAWLAGAGLKPLALGPRILRTETAAVAALTALQLKWGDLSAGGF